MTDRPHGSARYGAVLSTGKWEYRPDAGDDRWVKHWVALDQPRETLRWWRHPDCRTPADYRACAEVVERWEADHAPKMRRRVVQDTEDLRFYAVSLNGGIVWSSSSESQVRRWAAEGEEDLAARDVQTAIRMGKLYADLLARPDEKVPRGE
jgi:hypothetical protein